METPLQLEWAGPSPDAAARPTDAGGRLARFWELRGRRVFEAGGVIWGHHKGPFFTSLPFQRRVDLAPEELEAVFRGAGKVRGLTFPSNLPGLAAGHYAIQPKGYELKAVNRKQRGHVTRGLEVCEIRALDGDELLRKGMSLNRDTLDRQSREDATFLDPEKWKGFVKAVAACPGFTIHGAFVDGRLATYLISCREGGWLHLIYKMSSTAEREHYPNHALDFAIIRDAALDPGIAFIGNGYTSILPNEGLDRYKRQLGYEVREHNLRTHFHPWLAPVLGSPATTDLARRIHGWFPGNDRLAYGAKVLESASLSRASR